MRKVRIDPRTGLCYIPKSLRIEGFIGDIEFLENSVTVTLIRPGTELADVGKSLQLVRESVGLRIQQQGVDARRKVLKGDFPSSKEDDQTTPRRCHPVFLKYSRSYLERVLGYSKGYLSRIAKGRIPLSQSFVERACFRLQETEDVLFLSDSL